MPSDTPDAVFQALRENNERPYGRARTVRAEELVEAAEQFDDKGALVTALFELMSAYSYSGEQRKSPVVFARIMRLWDTGPGDFSEWEEHQVYWRFKWVTTALIQVPEVPLAAIERWTGEMRERYRTAGHGMQPVYAMRHRVAEHTGVGEESAYELWATRPRTDLSDCEACETRQRALHHVAAGDDTRALEMWAPVLGGGQSCMEEPYASMAYALLPLVRAGRLDEARSHHLVGYRFARGKADLADSVGHHLEFCALTRNEGRGLEVLAENRGLFEVTGSPLDRLGFLTGVEVLLARLAGQGHGGLAVAGPPGRLWTAGTLLERVRTDASALAAAFDARNGTSALGERRMARLARQPLLDAPLTLGIRAATLIRTAVTPEPAAAVEQIPADFTQLVLRARALTAVGRPDADALWHRIRALTEADGHVHDADALGSGMLLQAELAERDAFEGFDREDWEQARTVMLRAGALYELAGLPGRAATARARAITALVAANERDRSVDCSSARTELDAELRLAAQLLGADVLGGGSGKRAPADAGYGAGAFAGGTVVGASASSTVAGAGGTVTEIQTDGVEVIGIKANVVKASGAEARDSAGADHATGAAGNTAGRRPDGGGTVTGVEAGGRIESDRYLAILQCEAMVTRHAVLAELPEPSAGVRGDFEASVGRLLAAAERLGSPVRASAARQYAADVAARTGRFDLATEELTTALELIATAGQPWRTPRPLALLAQIKVQSGHADEAVPLIHQALSAAARWPDASLPLGPFHALLGHASAHCGDTTNAVRHLSEAADRLDRDGADEHAAQVRLELADLLTKEGRQADSVAVLESVVLGEPADLDPRLLAQIRLNLARGLAGLGEQRAAAEEFLRLADVVAEWTAEQFTHTLVACEAATALAKAGLWDAARTAYGRAVTSHATAPRPGPVAGMMREFARLTMAARDADGLAEALQYLAEADELCGQVPDGTADFVRWYQSGATHYQRGRTYAAAHAYEDALAELEHAIAHYDSGGHPGEEPRAEAIRIAALIEGNALGAVPAATVRLTAAIARCEAAGFPDAATALTNVRAGLTK